MKMQNVNCKMFFCHSCESRNPDAVPAKAGNYKELDFRFYGNRHVPKAFGAQRHMKIPYTPPLEKGDKGGF